MANTSTPNDNDVCGKGKRDREHGMFADSLVLDKLESIENELDTKLKAMTEEGRLADIYDFILEHRPGTPSGIHPSQRGSYNGIFRADFTDGSAVLRVVIPGTTAFPDEKVRAEVATMRYIEKMTSIPVPHIYHWGTAAENPLGLGAFIIMDYIPHDHNMSEILKDKSVKIPNRQYLDQNFPKDKLEGLYRQVAHIVLQLSKLEMPKIGFLKQDGDSFTVSSRPLAQAMNEVVVQGGLLPSILPPEHTTYSTAAEWYSALADLHMAHLTFQHNDAIESADDCRDKFVARHLFRQQTRQGKLFDLTGNRSTTNPIPPLPLENDTQKETFRLWIDDFRPHNILLDADLNITGVIDWEWVCFAPKFYTHDPPWWLLLGRPETWRGSVLEFRDEFDGVVDLFCKVLEEVEDGCASEKGGGDADGGDGEWDIDRHIESLSLKDNNQNQVPMRLSERMWQNWTSGAFWVDYAARGFYAFEPVFWEFLDELWFGKNVEGGFEGRVHLLSDKVKRRMEQFVVRKMEEWEDYRLVERDPEEAKSCLAKILADLDQTTKFPSVYLSSGLYPSKMTFQEYLS